MRRDVAGIVFCLAATLCWGALPLGLQYVLQVVDGVTVTWWRFTVAAAVCFAWQAGRGRLQAFAQLVAKDWWCLLGAATFLIVDYVGFTLALNYTSAAATQVFSQVTPLFLCLAGLLFFAERPSRSQLICLLILLAGLALFLVESLVTTVAGRAGIVAGAALATLASLSWAVYVILQKKLGDKLSSGNILLFIYAFAVIAMLPATHPESLSTLDASGWLVMSLCAANTLVAYGLFGIGLRYSTMMAAGAVLALQPLFTLASERVVAAVWPGSIQPEVVTPTDWLGIMLVVAGVVSFSLLSPREHRQNDAAGRTNSAGMPEQASEAAVGSGGRGANAFAAVCSAVFRSFRRSLPQDL